MSALESFTSPGGRTFAMGPEDRRDVNDSVWPILYQGERAGTLYRNLSYSRDGVCRWQATCRQLVWWKASDAPVGIGFDVSAFDTAAECLAAWARSADQILDWSEGRPVRSIYSKTGVFQKGTAP